MASLLYCQLAIEGATPGLATPGSCKLRRIVPRLKFAMLFGVLFLSSASWRAVPLRAQTNSLRVCADPNYLSYSNRAGEGFENKIAQAVAKAMGANLQYAWAPSRGHGGFPEFLAATLDAKKCDVVMSIPYGSGGELTTRPYYISSYVFVFKKARNYNLTGMDSAILKKLRIGFESDTPPEDALKMRGLLERSVVFNIAENSEETPASMLAALERDRIDVLITWEPAIGLFLKRHPELEVLPVPNSRALGPPERYAFPMSMGVREGDEAMRKQLDDVVNQHQAELTMILQQYGVELYASRESNSP